MSVCCSGKEFHFEANPNKYNVGTVTFEATGDRLIILEDEFRSGYGCQRCNPKGTSDPFQGKTMVTCDECEGTGTSKRGHKCAHCEGGKIVCPDCKGVGSSVGIVIAESTTRRPSTGKVVSAGEKCNTFKAGDSILYSNFSGYVIDLDGEVLRIIHETEVLSKIEGHLEYSRVRSKSELAAYQP